MGAVAACLVLPARAFGQINLPLKDGAAKIDASVSAADPKDKVQKNPGKTYIVELVGEQTYQIDMIKKVDQAGKAIDPFLRLEDAAGKELARDDDGGGELNARILFRAPKDGKYTIVATTFDGSTGPYSLSVRLFFKLVKGTDVALADGKAQVHGVLTRDDPTDTPGRTPRLNPSCKVYLVKLSAGKTYQIDMQSKEIDSDLRLEIPRAKSWPRATTAAATSMHA